MTNDNSTNNDYKMLFLKYLRTVKNYSDSTNEAYERDIRYFINWLNERSLLDVVIEDVWAFRDSLIKDDYHQNTINHIMIAVRQFYRFLKIKRLPVLDWGLIDVGRKIRAEVDFLTLDEVEKLIDSVEVRDVKDLRDKTMISMLYSSGLRISELVSLNRADIDFKTRQFRVIGKGKKPRTAFYDRRTAALLKKYLMCRFDDKPELFINMYSKNDTTRLTRSGFQPIIRHYALKAGLTKKVTAHILRHTFATRLVKKKVDIHKIKELLGHTYITTTQIYTHLENSDLKHAHSRVFRA